MARSIPGRRPFAGSACRAGLALLGAAGLVAACAPASSTPGTGAADEFRVVATTPILADMARQVAGPDATVTSLVPPGRDPHTFEPSLRTVREAAHADVALANGLLLEPAALTSTLEQTSAHPVVEVAEQARARGAQVIPLVENVALDAIWLGLKSAYTTAGDEVDFRLESVDGPGAVTAYIVGTFGAPQVVFDSARDGSGTRLPNSAHTHLSWAFSEPGIYQLRLSARAGQADPVAATVTVAVGVAPPAGAQVLDEGHVDIAADIDAGRLDLRDRDRVWRPEEVVIAVPSSTLQPIPPDPHYRFLGKPGRETYLLPQAVLGKHVHGELDPHLWHDLGNASSFVDVIADELALSDPSHGQAYRARAAAYQAKLAETNRFVEDTLAGIPAAHRHLVTTHDGYGYLAKAYGLKVAGFVTPSESVEPSPRDVMALRRTLRDLQVPAVFIEPNRTGGAGILEQTAREAGVQLCPIYGDTLDEEVPTYLDLMRFNAESLRRCLT